MSKGRTTTTAMLDWNLMVETLLRHPNYISADDGDINTMTNVELFNLAILVLNRIADDRS